ncbi:TetR/AcrR family transcriptional regulator [Vibrio atypicus]|uniref:TetR/AcrR family transcriptional regulator n=1 Tax=Vibrio atypicus TaxID=558271 RepID=UPI001357BDFF|nr:TetR/AcrR family transcriptional regulator [Vibrio atypicus]
MGKAAKFDREQVINKATNLYWQKGFHGTSMRNLQDVIDMRPGSIYAAFGSKDGLFKESLHNYTRSGIEHLANCQAETNSPLSALKLFMKQVVITSQVDAPNGMCMLAKSIAELTDEQAELLAEAKRCFQRMEQEFARVIAEAQAQGEVSKEKDPAILARYVQVQISGLRTYAKANNSDTPLEEMIEDVFNHHPF